MPVPDTDTVTDTSYYFRGLLGGHASCLYLQSVDKLSWYSNELLMLSVDLADRFLPAFDTPTGSHSWFLLDHI